MKTKIYTILTILLIILSINARAFDKIKRVSSKKPTPLTAGLKNKKIRNSGKNVYALADLTRNLEYDFAKSAIRTSYSEKLDQLAKYIIENKYALSLRGYADSIGSFKGNWVISDKRALAVKKYLVEKGVSDDKIVTTPFGSTKPIASNKTAAGRQKNRRVEIKLTEIK